jgi:hypothetical protein
MRRPVSTDRAYASACSDLTTEFPGSGIALSFRRHCSALLRLTFSHLVSRVKLLFCPPRLVHLFGGQRRHLVAIAAVASAAATAMTGVFLSGAGAAVAAQQHQHAADGRLPTIIVTMNGKKITVSGALRSGGVQVISKVTNECRR